MVARARKSDEKPFDASDFEGDLDGLADEAVNPEPYIEAAREGMRAVPMHADSPIDPHRLGQAQAKLRQKYAVRMQDRIGTQYAEFLNEQQSAPDGGYEAPGFWDAVKAKIDAMATDVTRYAEPPWSAGYAAYGAQLGEFDILMDWVLDDAVEHCQDCPDLAAGGPYSRDDIPTWPKQGETQCLDRCYCTIQVNAASWEAYMNGGGDGGGGEPPDLEEAA